MDYTTAGVNVAAADHFVERLKQLTKQTKRPGSTGEIGLFGGLFDLSKTNATPRLIASTDGVGTKSIVASWANRFDTIGECLVNHCVNDIAVLGTEPLFLLDTISTDRLNESRDLALMEGIVRGCVNNHIALIGGETAEMPDVYHDGHFEIGATIVGQLPEHIPALDGSRIQAGHEMWGVASSGLHTNGFSLARRVLLDQAKLQPDYELTDGSKLGDAFLAVHKSYLDEINAVKYDSRITGFSHITGGGIVGNTKRLLPKSLKVNVEWESWNELPIFTLIRKLGNVPEESMRQAFNLGIGLAIIAQPGSGEFIRDQLKQPITKIGTIEAA